VSALLDAFGAELKRTLPQQRGVIEFARVALPGLVDVCAAKTGQAYKLRALLYSAWNGQATSLLDGLTGLDWPIKKDVLTVLLAFGCEPGGGTPGFFYDAISDAFKAAGLFEWFCEASTASDEPE
jgi:hypothetical protein